MDDNVDVAAVAVPVPVSRHKHIISFSDHPSSPRNRPTSVPYAVEANEIVSMKTECSDGSDDDSIDGNNSNDMNDINDDIASLDVNKDDFSNSRLTLNRNKCFVCKKSAGLRCSKCKYTKLHYCGTTCQISHWKSHKIWCQIALQNQDSPEELKKKVVTTRNGCVGLLNLGNSCYLNSTIHCLSHIIPLTRYFLSNSYEREINRDNRDGTKGELSTEYCKLLKHLWFDSNAFIAPKALKNLIGTINPDYNGFQQQDAHELVNFLLNKLHEDLNRIGKKPYAEDPEGDGTNDEATAKLTWDRYMLREDSVIKDLLGILLRSYVQCPDCSKVSIKFDYALTIELPIPRSNNVNVNVINFVNSDMSALPTLSSVSIDRLSNILELKKKLLLAANVDLSLVNKMALIELHTQTHILIRVVSDIEYISNFAEGALFGLYSMEPLGDVVDTVIVLYQRLFVINNNRVEYTLVNYPLLICMASKWHLWKVRHAIWERIHHYLSRTSPIGRYAFNGWSLKEHMECCKYLPIRCVFQNGKSIMFDTDSPVGNADSDTIAYNGEVYKTNGAVDRNAYGVSLSCDKKDPLSQLDLRTLTKSPFIFMSVDWSDTWKDALDMDRLMAISSASNSSSSSSSVISLDTCLKEYTREETLEESNAWYCSSCKKHQAAKKQITFWRHRLPRILVFTLKRFEYRQSKRGGGGVSMMHREKIETMVDFPLNELDMSKYCTDDNGDSSSDTGVSNVYDLFAVCNHYGRMGFGHYTAFARNLEDDDELQQQWHQFDDNDISACEDEDVKTNAAYILFYRRRVT